MTEHVKVIVLLEVLKKMKNRLRKENRKYHKCKDRIVQDSHAETFDWLTIDMGTGIIKNFQERNTVLINTEKMMFR